MSTNNSKRNKGFTWAFRMGVFSILLISVIISWITVRVMEKYGTSNEKEITETDGSEDWTKSPDTVYVEQIKEKIIRDTVYIKVFPKPKADETSSIKKDSLK
jgi:hypothetical protein